jgi:energy-coupling factor transport system permease protein
VTAALAVPFAATSARPAAPGLDPRTKLAFLLATSVLVMLPGGGRFVPAALALGTALALSERAWRRAVLLVAAVGGLAVIGQALPRLWPHMLSAAVAMGADYGLRFAVMGGVALHLVATTTPPELTAGLRRLRVPRPVTVGLAVMIRFFPVLAAEALAVRDAMRLRGLGGWETVLRHPVSSLERFTVPFIAASLRAGEDLSASALMRGLGSHGRPTSLTLLRFRLRDGLTLTLYAAALAWSARPPAA